MLEALSIGRNDVPTASVLAVLLSRRSPMNEQFGFRILEEHTSIDIARPQYQAILGLPFKYFQEALDLTPEGHKRAGQLQSLGSAYSDRYRLTGALKDLELCIQQFQESLDLTLEGHPNRVVCFHSLGAGYIYQYRQTGVLSDLELGIQQYQEAFDLTSEGYPHRARLL